MKKILVILSAALVAVAMGGCATTAPDSGKKAAAMDAGPNGYGKQKVVYHINYDNPKQQAGALRNIQNHINAVGAENLDLRVVMHGNGVSLVLEPEALAHTKMKAANGNAEMQAKVANLKNQGIKFNICANTLRGKKINYEKDLYDVNKADIVPSGVAELSHLMQQGYAYIKP
ncbi:MAG: DsrE family protein [Gammaproteobacteria bacterium]|nr:DsrE family protein [Gammaproteobacteria bacterium]